MSNYHNLLIPGHTKISLLYYTFVSMIRKYYNIFLQIRVRLVIFLVNKKRNKIKIIQEREAKNVTASHFNKLHEL
jgi:hypothetical protein